MASVFLDDLFPAAQLPPGPPVPSRTGRPRSLQGRATSRRRDAPAFLTRLSQTDSLPGLQAFEGLAKHHGVGPSPRGRGGCGARPCVLWGGVGGTMTTKARPRASAHTGPAWCFKLKSEASPASSEGCAMSLSGDLNVKMVLVPLLSGHRTQALNDGLDEKRSACCSGS